MRDQYAGDISDYLKFAFINAMLPAASTLGVAWYYLPGHDGRADGRHDEYLSDPNWRLLSPGVFDRLAQRSERAVSELEALGVLPSSTRFFRDPIAGKVGRDAWARRMEAELSECSAVFADPDNGVSRPGVVSRKSATVQEISSLCGADRLVLLIRFPHRLSSHADQLSSYHDAFAEFLPITVRTCVRVPNANGSTSPRIRWFTALNGGPDARSSMESFAQSLAALPGASATVEG